MRPCKHRHRPNQSGRVAGRIVNLLCSTLLFFASFNLLADETPIPHGEIATAKGKGAVAAWYSCPTTRYRHGVLGDAIEGGCLHAQDPHGKSYKLVLPETHVFEDVTPRLADMNGDNRNDIIVITADRELGAALAIYAINEEAGELVELASTPPIGRANRWLAPAGIADFDNDGRNDVAYVETPHIGGTLRFWSLLDTGLEQLAQIRGFSNHAIGASRVSISRVLDSNNDGVPDLAVPGQFGSESIFVTLHPEPAVLKREPFDLEFYNP